jgi:Domain of unknown function (DUF3883)
MYRLLGDLPTRDPEGKNAPSIYRSLLEQGVRSEETPERQAFVTSGKMWGHLNDRAGYYPVAHLRYSSRRSLPAPVRKLIPLVDIDARRKAAEVERIFGVQQVKPSDMILSVDKTAIETRPWSCLASERFSQAIPFLYACRLARTADVDGREMRRLGGVSICVCAHLRASVTVEGVARDDVVFDRELEGVVAERTIFLISHRSEFPRMNQSFWRAVGDLLAEIIDAAVGGDFASILACESPQDMHDLLDQISDGDGDALLTKAKTRLTADVLRTATNEVLPVPPPPSAPAATTSAPSRANQDTETPAIETQAPTGAATFQQTQAPVRRAFERIQFSTGAHTARGGKRMVQITDETETTRIAIRYEEQDGRFTIATSHIRGYNGPRCDLLSVRSQEVRNRALEMHSISLDDVERFIEVKGRNQRTGAVELTENELLGAEKYGSRYFIYRVFCDPTAPASRELAILCDPMNSPAHKIYRTARFHFHDASGATWFALVPESVPDGDRDQK